MHAAIGFVTAMDDLKESRKGTWHESEVHLPRTTNEALSSPQRQEWWKGMEHEMAAMKEKDVLELGSESEISEGKKVLETMWRY